MFLRTSVLLAVLVAISAATRPLYVDTETNQFVDETGRQRFFRGLNVVFKRDPWMPVYDRFDAELSF